MTKSKASRHEALFWSIALPGFGQLLNGKLVKGCLFVLLEFLINVRSHFNLGIMYSFQGNFEQAQACLDFQWLLFYPCMYMFAMWDAYKDASGMPTSRYTYIPFVCGAVVVTTAIFYSTNQFLFGRLLGPVFFPLLSLLPALIIGFIIKSALDRRS